MRKISIFLIFILLFSFVNQNVFIGSDGMTGLTGMNTVYADVKADNLTLTSKSAILMSADSGEILYEKNSNQKLSPASITKIMLLILLSEKLNSGEIKLTDETTITKYAASMGGSQVFLEENEVQTVDSLLKAICMRSANDASVAMSELLYGSEEACVAQMNEKAIELGMESTHFVNVTGLPAENHISTAKDIALMSRELLKYNYANKYMVTWMDSIMVGKNKDIEQVLVNTNRLINNYDGLLGLKTGYTTDALYCLSAAAERKGTKFIAVVLGCPETKVRFAEAAKLLNHGFANYKNLIFYAKDAPITKVAVECAKEENINVVSRENISLLTTSNCKIEDYSLQYNVNKNLKAPLDYNTPIGILTISKDGSVVKEVELYPEKKIDKQPFFAFYFKMLKEIMK